jgi:hypothetical protein
MNLTIQNHMRKVERTINHISPFEVYDDEFLAHWAKYICILTSGLIEESVKNLIFDYVENKSTPQLSRYINDSIKRIANLNTEKIEKLLNSFNENWAIEFKTNLSESQKTAFDSIVALRNQIAHGKNVGVTFPRVKDYYLDIKDAIIMLNDKVIK